MVKPGRFRARDLRLYGIAFSYAPVQVNECAVSLQIMAVTCSMGNLSGQIRPKAARYGSRDDLGEMAGNGGGLPLDGHWRLHAP
jgi:hypothetical protein